MEIERKFLIAELPDLEPLGSGARLRQGYVAQEGDVEVRIRVADESRALLTVKAGRGLVRTEVEVAVAVEQADALWPITEGRRVTKTRYVVPLGRVSAELDVYADHLDGVLTVEVEFPSAEDAAAFEPPAWFGREITGERGWDNASLARFGAPG